NREASATSPTSMAVNTFSIRFGSRRNQRPVHQKMRSITTVRAMIDTIRIGHMIGPPLRKLSIKKLPVGGGPCGMPAAGDADAAADAAGEALLLNVTGKLAPGAGEPPPAGALGAPGAPGAALIAGAVGIPGGGGIAGAPGATRAGGNC